MVTPDWKSHGALPFSSFSVRLDWLEFSLLQDDLSVFTLDEHDHVANFDSELVSDIFCEGDAEVRLNLTAPEGLLQRKLVLVVDAKLTLNNEW